MLSIRNDILAYLVVSCIFVRRRKDINYGKLARSPEYPQRIRVASVFEPFIYLFIYLIA